MQVKDIMTKDLVSVNPTMDLHKFAQLLVEKNVSGAPVVDINGKFLGVALEEGIIYLDKKVHLPTFFAFAAGVITLGMHRFQEEMKKIAATQVKDILDKKVVAVSTDDSLEKVATLMVEKNLHYLPVLDFDVLVGVVTKRDFLRALSR